MTEILLGDIPLENPDFLKRRNGESGLLFHFPNRTFFQGLLPLDVAPREIEARPILLEPVLNEEMALFVIEHDHIGQNGCEIVSHREDSITFWKRKKFPLPLTREIINEQELRKRGFAMGRKAIKNIEKKILSEVMKETYKNGIAAVSTKEVARKLHVSEPVIFAHFETKQNLMTRAFEEAWNALPHIVAFPVSVQKEDDEEAFLRYKEKVNSALQNPVQLIYIADFINSRYYSYQEVLRVENDYRKAICSCFSAINPNVPDKDLDLLAERFIESSITSLSHVILGHHPHDDETLLLYWSARIYGFVGALTMAGAAAPEELKTLYGNKR